MCCHNPGRSCYFMTGKPKYLNKWCWWFWAKSYLIWFLGMLGASRGEPGWGDARRGRAHPRAVQQGMPRAPGAELTLCQWGDHRGSSDPMANVKTPSPSCGNVKCFIKDNRRQGPGSKSCYGQVHPGTQPRAHCYLQYILYYLQYN